MKTRNFLVSAAYQSNDTGISGVGEIWFYTFLYRSEYFPTLSELKEEAKSQAFSSCLGVSGITEISEEDAERWEQNS